MSIFCIEIGSASFFFDRLQTGKLKGRVDLAIGARVSAWRTYTDDSAILDRRQSAGLLQHGPATPHRRHRRTAARSHRHKGANDCAQCYPRSSFTPHSSPPNRIFSGPKSNVIVMVMTDEIPFRPQGRAGAEPQQCAANAGVHPTTGSTTRKVRDANANPRSLAASIASRLDHIFNPVEGRPSTAGRNACHRNVAAQLRRRSILVNTAVSRSC